MAERKPRARTKRPAVEGPRRPARPGDRSGSNRTYAERMAGGRPNVTMTLPIDTIEILKRLAEDVLHLSRSGVVELALRELAKKHPSMRI